MNEINSKLQSDKCPFWSTVNNKECGISSGGVYIPMSEDIRRFCLSPNYLRCPQYLKGCETMHSNNGIEVNESAGNGDRRKMRRYAKQIFLDLLVCDKNIGLSEMNTFKAKSTDASLGGLRIESSQDFAKDADVFFILDPQFSAENFLGFGKVKWSRPKKNSAIFEYGIAFSSYSTTENMREYLAI